MRAKSKVIFTKLGGPVIKRYGFLICIMILLLACNKVHHVSEDEWLYPPADLKTKVLLGIDGADWRFIVPLMKQGKLPAIQKLVRRGAFGNLISQTMASPVEWTIIATGQSPEKNGITGFVVHDQKKGKKSVVSGNLRKVKAFWNILTEKIKPVGVIGWWATWPAEKINGIMVSDLFPFRDTVQQSCYPQNVQSDLEKVSRDCSNGMDSILETDFKISSVHTTEMATRTQQDVEASDNTTPNLGLFRRDFRYDLEKTRYFNYLVTQQKSGQLALFLNSTDIASHLFYQCTAPKSENGGWPENNELTGTYHRVIEMAYRYAETPLHSMLENIRDLDFICIVSDHGFTSVPYTLTARWNILLHKLGLVDYKEGSDTRKFRSIDWEKTIAYFDPRKPHRDLAITINPDYQAPRTTNNTSEMFEKLVIKKMSLVRLENGQSLFTFLGKDQQTDRLVFKVRQLPFDPSRKIIIDRKRLTFDDLFFPPRLSGRHRKEGIVIIWGAGISPQEHLPASTTFDIAPTLLWANDLPASREMEGNVLVHALSEKALTSRPPEKIDTYGPRNIEPIRNSLSDAIDSQIKTKLRALGYID